MPTAAISSRPIRGLSLLVGGMMLGEMLVADPSGRATGAKLLTTQNGPGPADRTSLELANLELRQRHSLASVEHLQKALSLAHTEAVAHHLACVRTLVTP